MFLVWAPGKFPIWLFVVFIISVYWDYRGCGQGNSIQLGGIYTANKRTWENAVFVFGKKYINKLYKDRQKDASSERPTHWNFSLNYSTHYM